MKKRNLTLASSEPAPAIDWSVVDAAAASSTPDASSPELTDAQATALRPVEDVLPVLLNGKTRITIMLDDAILQAYKARAGKRGYQTLINETLRRGLEVDTLKEALRQVLREERHGPGVSEDFMEERASQDQEDREPR